MKIQYNIIVEVLNDGAGDWAYSIYLLELLIKMGVTEEQIRIIYINTYEYDKDLNSLINTKLKKNIELLQCKIINGKNIIDAQKPNLEIVKYTFTNRNDYFNKTKSIEKITTIEKKLYNLDEQNLTSVDFNNIFNIINNLLQGFKVPEIDISYGDYYCEVEKKELAKEYINLTDLYNTNVKNQGYPYNRIATFLFPKYKKISLIYLDHTYFFESDIKNNDIFKNNVNILFRTQWDNIEKFIFPNLIHLREGGNHIIPVRAGGDGLKSDYSLNCSIRYGYIKAKVEGDRTKFETYCRSTDITPLNSHVCYISLNDNNYIAKKLSKFIKILCYSSEIANNNKILMIGNWDELFSDINFSDPKRKLDLDIIIVERNNNEITVTFNGKNLIIKKISSINLKNNGFNFSYLLNETNLYCMCSGDTSYMEGLTLNKKVIHVGMSHKYHMINEINKSIIRKIGNPVFYEILDIEKNIDEVKSNIYNDRLELYSQLLSNPKYIEIQNSLTVRNFDDTVIRKINKITSQIKDFFKKKYLKYKKKYLQLKK